MIEGIWAWACSSSWGLGEHPDLVALLRGMCSKEEELGTPDGRSRSLHDAVKDESESPARLDALVKGEAEAVPAIPAALTYGLKEKVEQAFLKARVSCMFKGMKSAQA